MKILYPRQKTKIFLVLVTAEVIVGNLVITAEVDYRKFIDYVFVVFCHSLQQFNRMQRENSQATT